MTDEDFRAEVRAFIAAELPADMAKRVKSGYHPHPPDSKFWTEKLNAKGWAALHWPVEYGGTGWSLRRRHIFEEESFLAGCPMVNPQGFALVAPLIYSYGTEDQKARFLPKMLTGEHAWAQGFSEPNAGSDLASLQTRAVRDGDDYVVNGQKIWTSQAHVSNWLFLLVRTSTEGKPQAGISFLLVDLKTPGITIRPIISIDGGHSLNEVFFTDVRVPAENLLGEENKGWTYAKQLLGAERSFSSEVPRCKALVVQIRNIVKTTLARGRPLIEDPHFVRRLAQLEIELLAHEATLWRVMAEEEAGVGKDSPVPSILKVQGSVLSQKLGSLAVEALGDDALPDYPEHEFQMGDPEGFSGNPLAPGVVAYFLLHRAATIYGGAYEVQHNIIAAQLLRA